MKTCNIYNSLMMLAIITTVAGTHSPRLRRVQSCWTRWGTRGTCTTLHHCGNIHPLHVLIQSFQENLCYWKQGQPYICCPNAGRIPNNKPALSFGPQQFASAATGPGLATSALSPQLPQHYLPPHKASTYDRPSYKPTSYRTQSYQPTAYSTPRPAYAPRFRPDSEDRPTFSRPMGSGTRPTGNAKSTPRISAPAASGRRQGAPAKHTADDRIIFPHMLGGEGSRPGERRRFNHVGRDETGLISNESPTPTGLHPFDETKPMQEDRTRVDQDSAVQAEEDQMKVEDMPTVDPFPMMQEGDVVIDGILISAEDSFLDIEDNTPQDIHKVCGRADPIVLAAAEEAEILRVLYPEAEHVLAVPGLNDHEHDLEDLGGQEARVTGGTASIRGRWPWMAIIGQANETSTTWLCGGTIVDEYHVLTAAHCVVGRPNVVQFGDHELDGRLGSHLSQRRAISKITLHPRYRPPKAYHDLAVLTLASKMTFSRYVRPICLPEAGIRLRRGQAAKITGHGYSEFNGGELSTRLQEAQIQLIKRKFCNASYARLGDTFFGRYPQGVLSHMLCAGTEEGGVDACHGDSGGPLMQHSDEMNGYVQIGVISTGFGCGNPEFPGLYVSVKHHLDFIRAVIRSHPSKNSVIDQVGKPDGQSRKKASPLTIKVATNHDESVLTARGKLDQEFDTRQTSDDGRTNVYARMNYGGNELIPRR